MNVYFEVSGRKSGWFKAELDPDLAGTITGRELSPTFHPMTTTASSSFSSTNAVVRLCCFHAEKIKTREIDIRAVPAMGNHVDTMALTLNNLFERIKLRGQGLNVRPIQTLISCTASIFVCLLFSPIDLALETQHITVGTMNILIGPEDRDDCGLVTTVAGKLWLQIYLCLGRLEECM
jgi:hypothetical protein